MARQFELTHPQKGCNLRLDAGACVAMTPLGVGAAAWQGRPYVGVAATEGGGTVSTGGVGTLGTGSGVGGAGMPESEEAFWQRKRN